MTEVIVDTDVVSFLFKSHPIGQLYDADLAGRAAGVSFMTVAEVMVAAQAAGRRIETADAWIAATALLYEAPLVTHNGSDYLGVPGLKLISPGS